MKITQSPKPGGEIFVIREHNVLIDISRLIDAINGKTISVQEIDLKLADLSRFVLADAVDEPFLKNIKNEKRDEPLIITDYKNNNRVIDGNHRLVKRARDGFDFCSALLIRGDDLENFTEPFEI